MTDKVSKFKEGHRMERLRIEDIEDFETDADLDIFRKPLHNTGSIDDTEDWMPEFEDR